MKKLILKKSIKSISAKKAQKLLDTINQLHNEKQDIGKEYNNLLEEYEKTQDSATTFKNEYFHLLSKYIDLQENYSRLMETTLLSFLEVDAGR